MSRYLPRIGLQINDQATTTNSESNPRILQRYKPQPPRKVASDRKRIILRTLGETSSTVSISSQSKHVSRVDEEENRRIEGDRLRRQFAHGHPSGRERK